VRFKEAGGVLKLYQGFRHRLFSAMLRETLDHASATVPDWSFIGYPMSDNFLSNLEPDRLAVACVKSHAMNPPAVATTVIPSTKSVAVILRIRIASIKDDS